jgi:hypothetical protein
MSGLKPRTSARRCSMRVDPGLSTTSLSAREYQYVKVRNTGLGVLPLRWIGITGTNASGFGPNRGCPIFLLPGKVCDIWVWFEPATVGTKAATLMV